MAIEGAFPEATLVVRFGDRGYRHRLFTDDEGSPLGPWADIVARLRMCQDAGRFAVELWVDIEEGLDSHVWDDEWSIPDAHGVRWVLSV